MVTINTFFTCNVSLDGRCHVRPWLNELSGVVLTSFTLSSRSTVLREVSLKQTGRLVQPLPVPGNSVFSVMGQETCEETSVLRRLLQSGKTSKLKVWVTVSSWFTHVTARRNGWKTKQKNKTLKSNWKEKKKKKRETSQRRIEAFLMFMLSVGSRNWKWNWTQYWPILIRNERGHGGWRGQNEVGLPFLHNPSSLSVS